MTRHYKKSPPGTKKTPHPWQDHEIEILTKNWGKMRNWEIAELLPGRTANMVTSKGYLLNLAGLPVWKTENKRVTNGLESAHSYFSLISTPEPLAIDLENMAEDQRIWAIWTHWEPGPIEEWKNKTNLTPEFQRCAAASIAGYSAIPRRAK